MQRIDDINPIRVGLINQIKFLLTSKSKAYSKYYRGCASTIEIYLRTSKRSALLNNYHIRKLKEDDLPQLIKLIKAVWAEFGFDHNHPDSSHLII